MEAAVMEVEESVNKREDEVEAVTERGEEVKRWWWGKREAARRSVC